MTVTLTAENYDDRVPVILVVLELEWAELGAARSGSPLRLQSGGGEAGPSAAASLPLPCPVPELGRIWSEEETGP